ncbi:MAG: hypothetical protein JSV09_15460 [Thermoplasmata archaeon]|nr:MAG: hypothetical protein JSV09_15460 [Thermoplasmata archaeon]
MNFPYIFLEGRYLPIVPLELKGNEWIELRAFVDSGASYSIFHADIAEILGLDFTKGEKNYMTVGDGVQIPVYTHDVKVHFSQQEFTAKIGFSNKLGIGFDILGREGFFDRFIICFDDKEKIVKTIDRKD